MCKSSYRASLVDRSACSFLRSHDWSAEPVLKCALSEEMLPFAGSSMESVALLRSLADLQSQSGLNLRLIKHNTGNDC